MLVLHCCVWAFSSCERVESYSLVSIGGGGFSRCGTQALLLHGMWDLPRPGIKPVSPTLASRFPTTGPTGKPYDKVLKIYFANIQVTGEVTLERVNHYVW